MNKHDLLDKIKGGIYGVAIGDALGGTTEFMSVREIHARYGYLTEIIGGGVWRLEPGEVTDDTMMTLCVAEGILENPKDPLEAIGVEFMKWYQTRPKDIGNIIRHTFENVEKSWFEAAYITHNEMGQSAGNGSLMRCLPVALAYTEWKDIEKISHMQSKMTHYDERCNEACILYNRIAYRLLKGEEMKDVIQQELIGTEYERILTSEPNCEATGFVVHTFRWVLHILLKASNFSEVVQRAANLGGDSDTIGAIAGGLAGIYYGYEQIPTKYAEAILIREQLDELAVRLVGVRDGL
ncbi:ADP-ribosyl-[dinitrogen reductase] glycohydrolase [Paenibacillus allorhizoplanae]|uniref:ADP-ribosyl-[dinitrogen reductase] glycohydrolase n=1 Tax=Paenibacillus allorhizoplanae TaxID=2905648 RepID=A0ABM9CBV5_9BACL|nr:ADP-ribosylglycohydrolase family protein [Paenibacillus allorhizoplanae]CAH1208094.1 ADP-ribosyl-[dinitrogen reductase] glycohydrolase [Paenibacillus allorhizoplanae]